MPSIKIKPKPKPNLKVKKYIFKGNIETELL